MSTAPSGEPPALTEHLATYLGTWPPADGVDLVASARRLEPAWDGSRVLAVVVTSPTGTVASVPPTATQAAQKLVGRLDDPAFPDHLAVAVGAARRASPWLVLRWSTDPAHLEPAGRWLDPAHPALPDWLRVFPDRVLVALDDDGGYLAGLGIKPHTVWGRELAVGTAEAARGRGLARRLVAQAAREVLDEGGVPLYVHHPGNAASARVADAAGFPDRGWRLLVVTAPANRAP